jgi:hypothetical protein
MALLDLGFVVSALADSTLTVTTTGPDTVDTAGVVTRGEESTTTVSGSLQPASGKDLQGLPEGQRTAQSWTLYTTTPLATRTAGTPPEMVTVGTDVYDVVRVDSFAATGGFYRYLLQKRPGPGSGF